jgi:hypothetical protein
MIKGMIGTQCLQIRFNSVTNPEEAFEALEKISILQEILESVINFETKLMNDLDVD